MVKGKRDLFLLFFCLTRFLEFVISDQSVGLLRLRRMDGG